MVEPEDESLEPVPPKSPINFWNAELSVDKVLDDKVAEEADPLPGWLSPKSCTKDCSSGTMPRLP